MTLVAVCGNASSTTSFALASTWPTPDRLLMEADPSGGDLAAWLDLPEAPGVASAVAAAPSGSWPVVQAQGQRVDGLDVLVMPIRAAEAAVAAREAASRLTPTLSALAGTTVIADCGRLLSPGLSPVATQAALVVVTVRQPRSSARAAAAVLDRVAETIEALGAWAVPTALVVVGEDPYRPAEIEEYLGAADHVPVYPIADDPIGAAIVAGRDRIGRGFGRTQLARTARVAAAQLAVRLDSIRSVDGRARR